jgi:endonuclease YncB( thermonuclease family)
MPAKKKSASISVTVRPRQGVTPHTYDTLVRVVRQELDELDFFIRRRTAESYWRVGKFIHEHLLGRKDRAEHGSSFFEKLAEDVARDSSTLQKMLRFYRVYPILARGPELSWSHYRVLTGVKDKEKRSRLEKEIVRNNWDAQQLQDHLRSKRALAAARDDEKSVPRLKVTRGQPDTYRVVEPEFQAGPLRLDAGFRLRLPFVNGKAPRAGAGDLVLMDPDDPESFSRTTAAADEIFTYRARVGKIIDGDTFWVSFALPLGATITHKARLRGIDCPEINTEEGRAAKRFVEKRLRAVDFIIVKTWKDSTDKYERYLADVFYEQGAHDPGAVAGNGKYLNQELLDEGLAVVYGV